MEWSPSPGMRTIAGQLVEIIAVEAPLVPYLKAGYLLTEAEVDAIVGDSQNETFRPSFRQKCKRDKIPYVQDRKTPLLK